MRATQDFVASTQSKICPTPSNCPSLEEMWACVEGERSHEEVRRLIQHCSFCDKCADRWRDVCEQSLDGGKPPVAAAPLLSASAQYSEAIKPSPAPDPEEGQNYEGNLNDMANRYEEENFARPSLMPWAIGAGVVMVALFFLMVNSQ